MLGAIAGRILLRHIYTFGFNMDAVYAPMFVLGAAKVFEELKGKWAGIFSVLGKYSTGMWLIHSVFFTTYTKEYFQPVMTAVKWPPMMFVWLVVLSFVLAFIYRKILDGIQNVMKILKGKV